MNSEVIWVVVRFLYWQYHTLTDETGVKPGYYRDAAAHNRWRNFQHTMARVTSSRLIYCDPFNSLQDLVQAEEPKPGAKRHLEYDIIAAAQWVLWPTECRYVYQECLKKETTVHYWEPWSKEFWGQVKKEFELVVDSPLYDDHTKSVARKTLQRMKDTEEEVDEEGSVGSGED